jgi:hypothetical protein
LNSSRSAAADKPFCSGPGLRHGGFEKGDFEKGDFENRDWPEHESWQHLAKPIDIKKRSFRSTHFSSLKAESLPFKLGKTASTMVFIGDLWKSFSVIRQS